MEDDVLRDARVLGKTTVSPPGGGIFECRVVIGKRNSSIKVVVEHLKIDSLGQESWREVDARSPEVKIAALERVVVDLARQPSPAYR